MGFLGDCPGAGGRLTWGSLDGLRTGALASLFRPSPPAALSDQLLGPHLVYEKMPGGQDSVPDWAATSPCADFRLLAVAISRAGDRCRTPKLLGVYASNLNGFHALLPGPPAPSHPWCWWWRRWGDREKKWHSTQQPALKKSSDSSLSLLVLSPSNLRVVTGSQLFEELV